MAVSGTQYRPWTNTNPKQLVRSSAGPRRMTSPCAPIRGSSSAPFAFTSAGSRGSAGDDGHGGQRQQGRDEGGRDAAAGPVAEQRAEPAGQCHRAAGGGEAEEPVEVVECHGVGPWVPRGRPYLYPGSDERAMKAPPFT